MFFNFPRKYIFIIFISVCAIAVTLFVALRISDYSIFHQSQEKSVLQYLDLQPAILPSIVQKIPSIHVTIFIHGTVGSTLNVFNPWSLASEDADVKGLGVSVVKRYRSQPIMQYDQILGDEGFYELYTHNYTMPTHPLIITMHHEQKPWYATAHLIPCYQELLHSIKKNADIEKSAIFGWSGLLHARARKEAGFTLYHQLCDYIEQLKKEYGAYPKITIVAHSHGGNVALWLAAAENQCQRGLMIDTLCMYGTPMHKEMQKNIESPVFKTILLFHSHGDSIQLRDYFSTKAKKSYQKMSDVADVLFQAENDCKRCDICCVVNGNYKGVTHTNMWLAGRSIPIFDHMDPLPFCVLTPLMTTAFKEQDLPVWCEAHFINNVHGFSLQIYDAQQKKIVYEAYENDCTIPALLKEWGQKMKKEWQLADDCSRHPLFNKKNYKALKNMLWGS